MLTQKFSVQEKPAPSKTSTSRCPRPSRPPTIDKLSTAAFATATTTPVTAIPHSSQRSQASESQSEYSNELSEDSQQTDTASEPSTTEFPVTPRQDQSPPQCSFGFDSDPVPCDDQYSDIPSDEVAFGNTIARGKEVCKEIEELDGDELYGCGESDVESVDSLECGSDLLGVGSWFGGSCDEEDDEYDDDDYVSDDCVDGEPDFDMREAEPESSCSLTMRCPNLVCGDLVRVAPERRPSRRGIVPVVVGAVAGVDY